MTLKVIEVGSEYDEMRLDRFVLNNTSLSKGLVQKLIRKGDVKINGKKAEASDHVHTLDEIKIYNAAQSDLPAASFVQGLPKVKVVYEDPFILAVNKPSGLNTQQGGQNNDCLNERIKLHLKDVVLHYNGVFVPAAVNRLDYGTSGIVLCGKTPTAAKELSRLIRENKIKKYYVALIFGEMKRKIKAECYAKKDTAKNIMLPCNEGDDGAVKMVAVYESLGVSDGMSLVKARLITGKTHQIRFQLSSLGYPLVGDNKYGNVRKNKIFKEKYGLDRMFLHCCETSFDLWDSSGNLRLVCEMPEELRSVCKKMGLPTSIINEDEVCE